MLAASHRFCLFWWVARCDDFRELQPDHTAVDVVASLILRVLSPASRPLNSSPLRYAPSVFGGSPVAERIVDFVTPATDDDGRSVAVGKSARLLLACGRLQNRVTSTQNLFTLRRCGCQCPRFLN